MTSNKNHNGKAWHVALIVLTSVAALSLTRSAARTTGVTREPTRSLAVFSNPSPITISDAPVGNIPPGIGSPYGSTINVTGEANSLVHIQVTLNNVNHAFPDDLDVLLVAPGASHSFYNPTRAATLQ